MLKYPPFFASSNRPNTVGESKSGLQATLSYFTFTQCIPMYMGGEDAICVLRRGVLGNVPAHKIYTAIPAHQRTCSHVAN